MKQTHGLTQMTARPFYRPANKRKPCNVLSQGLSLFLSTHFAGQKTAEHVTRYRADVYFSIPNSSTSKISVENGLMLPPVSREP